MEHPPYALIANIGARSLVWKRQDGTYEALERDFFELLTQDYWLVWEKLAEIEDRQQRHQAAMVELTTHHTRWTHRDPSDQWEVTILPPLLEELKNGFREEEQAPLQLPHHLLLFVSDQGSGTVQRGVGTKQDTRYAGRIIKEFLPLQYPLSCNIDIKTITAQVYRADDLLKAYWEALEKLNEDQKYQDLHFVLCDTGGTAQQKAALQLATEYLFDKKEQVDTVNGYRYTFWQVREEYNGKDIKLNGGIPHYLGREIYRKMLNNKEVQQLVEQGNYRAAIALRSSIVDASNDRIIKILECTHLRSRLLLNDAREIYQQFAPNSKKFPPIYDFYQKNPLGTYTQSIPCPNTQQPLGKWEDCLDKASFIRVCEAFTIAEYYYTLEQWTDLVLAIQTFIENYLRDIIYYNIPVAYYHRTQWTHLIADEYKMRNLFPTKDYDPKVKRQFDLSNKLQRTTVVNTVDKKVDVCNRLKGSTLHEHMMGTFYRCHSGIFKNLQFDHAGIRDASEKAKRAIKEAIQAWHPYDQWINGLRNKIAHTGEGVASEQVLDKAVVTNRLLAQKEAYKTGLDPYIINSIQDLLLTWRQLLGIQGDNVYQKVNAAIIKQLKIS